MLRLVVSLGKWPQMVGETREHSKDIRRDFQGFVLGGESWKNIRSRKKGQFSISLTLMVLSIVTVISRRWTKWGEKIVQQACAERWGARRRGRRAREGRAPSDPETENEPKKTRFRIKMTIMILMFISYHLISFVTRNSPKHPFAH